MAKFKVGDHVLWDDPWRRDWGVPMDTREWTVFDVREDMVCICTGRFGCGDYAEAEVPPQELHLLWVVRIKAIAIKVAKRFVFSVWFIGGLAIATYTLYVVGVVLGECIPDGTSGWVRLAIGVPCILVIPVCVVILYIKISKWLDRLTDYKVLGLRFA